VRRYFSGFVRFKTPPLLVANGVDTSVFHPLDEERRMALRQQLGAGGETPLLLFVGRFVEKKGLPALRRLAEQLPQTRWMFAGSGPLDPRNGRFQTSPFFATARARGSRSCTKPPICSSCRA